MTITYCDVTKKPIENASNTYSWETKERRYDTIKTKDLSPEGMRKLEKEVFDEMDKNRAFNFMEYKKILAQKLDKVTK